MSDTDPTPKHPHNILCLGLAGSSFVAITQLVTRSDILALPLPLRTAVVCFAISIPPMVVFAFTSPDLPTEKFGRIADVARFGFRIKFISIIASLLGLACLFLAFGWLPGIAFLVSSTAAAVFVLLHAASSSSPPRQSPDPQTQDSDNE